MNEHPAELLARIETVAGALAAENVRAAAENLQQHLHAPKLRLLMAGSSGSGRATMANALLGRSVLPVSPIPRPPAAIALRHAERATAVRFGPDGLPAAVAPDVLGQVLREAGEGERVEIGVDADLLLLCDLDLLALEDERTPEAWQAALQSADYVIMVLNAAALLSTAERRFIRRHLAGEYGLERVAFVLNQIDRVPAEERDSLLDLLRAFLGSLQSEPAILAISAQQAAAEGSDLLATFTDDLLNRRRELRDAGLRGALTGLLDDLAETADHLLAVYAMEGEEIGRARETIAGQSSRLEGRIARMQGRAEAMIVTVLREHLQRRIERFGGMVAGRLPEEITTVADLTLARRHLPGYIETVWNEFLRGETVALRRQVTEQEDQIAAMIEDDLREMFAGAGPGVAELAHEIEPATRGLHVFLMPSRGKHRASNVARSLSLNGFITLFFAPVAGILSLAAAQAVQRAYKGGIDQANREALARAAVAANRELEQQVHSRVDQQFAALKEQMNADIAAAYREAVETVDRLLAEREGHAADLAARRDEVERIAGQDIPALRAAVLGSEGVPA